jgi:hypothetical protein
MLTRFIQSNRVPRELKIRLLASAYPLFPADKRKGVFMWHHGRCGSTVLGQILNQHPGIRWRGEIYERYAEAGTPRPNFRDDLKYAQIECGRKLPGFELKGLPSQHLPTLGVSLGQFMDAVREHGFSHCVFLDRRNTLRKLISVQIVDQGLRSAYHMSGKETALSGRLKIDVQHVRIQGKYAPLLDMIRHIDEETEKARHLVREYFDFLPLYYEDHIEADPLVAYREILAHLGLPDHDANVPLKRINVKTLQELVENHQEVEDLLTGTKYEWMVSQ